VKLRGAAPTAEDFATGWLAGNRSWGRPVDLTVAPDGALFLSDDGLGAVYRITYRGG
jgi:glucose/arabinose dehydrogenase